MTSPSDRDNDIVLFGASGFVGRLTARYLAEQAPEELRVALAGRSAARLDAIRAELGDRAAHWPVIVVDAGDSGAVADLAARTRVLVTTVGPYETYGKPLAAACARAGTHYADLTGEILFARWSVDTNHAAARESGARIVHSCGFDSIPSDLGVFVTARRAAEDGEGTLGETTLYVRSMRGGFSGGTIDSMRQQARVTSASPEARRVVADSYALSPARGEEPPSRSRPAAPPGPVDRVLGALPVGRAESGRFTAPFVMAGYNTRVVRRSNALTDWSYGRDFRYRELTDTGSGVSGIAGATGLSLALGALAGGMLFGPTRAVLDRVLPKPGEGPSETAMAAGRFVMDIETTTTTGARYRTRVAAEKDPGYTGTAVMLGESALALALDEADLPDRAGVLTPATGIGMVLVDRLRAQGFTIETQRR